jgi:hypothetical protein
MSDTESTEVKAVVSDFDETGLAFEEDAITLDDALTANSEQGAEDE